MSTRPTANELKRINFGYRYVRIQTRDLRDGGWTYEIRTYNPVNGAYEVNINENLYIGGHFRDWTGDPIRGERVYFSVTPDTVGEITPWAITEPDSNNGFRENVVFNGTVEDTVLIRGWVGDVNIIAQDTMSIWVRPPINE